MDHSQARQNKLLSESNHSTSKGTIKQVQQEIAKERQVKRQRVNQVQEVIEIIDDDDDDDQKNTLKVSLENGAGNSTVESPLAFAERGLSQLPTIDMKSIGALAGPTVQTLIRKGEDTLDSEKVAQETVKNIARFLTDDTRQISILTLETISKLSQDFIHALRMSTTRAIQLAFIETNNRSISILSQIETYYESHVDKVRTKIIDKKIHMVQEENLKKTLSEREKAHRDHLNGLKEKLLVVRSFENSKEIQEMRLKIENEKIRNMKYLRDKIISGYKNSLFQS